MTERILVGFAGDRAGACGLSWGQTAIWRAIQRLVPNDASLNMSWITALEDEGVSFDTPIGRITDTVGFLMQRHESLRTLFRVDTDGPPGQVLLQSGEIAIEIVDATREGAAAAA